MSHTIEPPKGDRYRDELMRTFREITNFFETVIGELHPDLTFSQFISETEVEFEMLIPEIPYIGGKKNRLTENLEGSVMMVALYRVLHRRGLTTREVGEIVYHATKLRVQSMSRLKIRFLSWLLQTRLARSVMKRMAQRTQKREYPEDWVMEWVEGDDTFDFGLDYTECAIVKFCKKHGAEEFARYLCLIDFVTARATRSGLFRTTTLAEGADRCDFRWKQGHESREGWPPPWEDLSA